MKIVDGFRLRKIMDEAVIVGEGAKQVNFNKIMSLNPTAAYLWEIAEKGDFTNEELANALVAKYNIDLPTALADVKDLTKRWIELGLVYD